MNQLSQNVDAPTCEVIVEHRIIDAPTFASKGATRICSYARSEDVHEQRCEAQQRPNFL